MASPHCFFYLVEISLEFEPVQLALCDPVLYCGLSIDCLASADRYPNRRGMGARLGIDSSATRMVARIITDSSDWLAWATRLNFTITVREVADELFLGLRSTPVPTFSKAIVPQRWP